ncbi:hypothetical protein Tco_1169120 [Tanacetum coccineum]
MIVKEIDKLLKGFLWCQGELSKGKAKVAWKSICLPKQQGGLGLKNQSVWNEVLMSKHLWNLACNKESLWVKWMNVVRLKGKSIWEIKVEANSSCGWKQILGLRDKIRPHIIKTLGNGNETFFWHDKWCEIGPLSNVFGLDLMSDSAVDLNVKVSDMWENKGWKWPKLWDKALTQIVPYEELKLDKEDKTLWLCSNGKKDKFSVKNVWKDIGPSDQNVPWCKLICQISNMRCNKSIMSILRRLVIAASVYYIWQERNKRLFLSEQRSWECLVNIITNTIRLRLASFRVKKTKQTAIVADKWKIQLNAIDGNDQRIIADLSFMRKWYFFAKFEQLERLIQTSHWIALVHWSLPGLPGLSNEKGT